jgi:hypothetical protein
MPSRAHRIAYVMQTVEAGHQIVNTSVETMFPRSARMGRHADATGQTCMTQGLDIGGYEQRPDWPNVGTVLLSTVVSRKESIFPQRRNVVGAQL